MSRLLACALLLLAFMPAVFAQTNVYPVSDKTSQWACNFGCLSTWQCWDDDNTLECWENDGTSIQEVYLDSTTDPETDDGFQVCMRHMKGGAGTAWCELRLYDPTNGNISSTGQVTCPTNYTLECFDIDEADAAYISSAGFAGGWYFRAYGYGTGSAECNIVTTYLVMPAAASEGPQIIVID